MAPVLPGGFAEPGIIQPAGSVEDPGLLAAGMTIYLTLTNVLILVFLLPNFTHFYIPYADQRWSIVVEEQFYLMQPFLVRVFKKRKRLLVAFLVIVFSPELWSGLVGWLHAERFLSANVIEALTLQLKYLACIAVGCIFSVLFFMKENDLKRILFSKWVQLAGRRHPGYLYCNGFLYPSC